MSDELKSQKLENQRVEHENLIHVATVTQFSRNAYVVIDDKRHKVYPTGNDNEPWTTNLHLAVWE